MKGAVILIGSLLWETKENALTRIIHGSNKFKNYHFQISNFENNTIFILFLGLFSKRRCLF